MKTIFITGVTGQLAAYLSKLYINKGYRVVGGIRRSANFNPWRLEYMGIKDEVIFEYFDLADQSSIDTVISKWKPDLMANCAAQSFVGSSWRTGAYTLDVTGIGVYRCLEALHKFSPHTRFLQMSSSELFGNNPDYPYNEKSTFMPRSPYAIAKAVGFYSVINFRESFQMFNSNLVSFNFESPLRGPEFVTKKITSEVARIDKELQRGNCYPKPLVLGNIDAKRDWIWAGDTARAVELILDHNKSDDFCIASGTTTSVQDFCTMAFESVGQPITWHDGKEAVIKYGSLSNGYPVVESRKSLYRPADVPHLIGDATKAKTILGWQPTKDLRDIINEMIEFEYEN